MTQNKSINPGLLNRSLIVYMLVTIVFLTMINFNKLVVVHTTYLGMRFSAEDKKNYRDGILYYTRLVKIDPREILEWRNLGICYYKRQEYSKALDCYKRIILLAPKEEKFLKELESIYAAALQAGYKPGFWK